MKLFTQAQYDLLLTNGRQSNRDYPPFGKLFTPDAGCMWLLSEIDPEEPAIVFGLCDLSFSFAASALQSVVPCAASWACRLNVICRLQPNIPCRSTPKPHTRSSAHRRRQRALAGRRRSCGNEGA